MAMNGIAIRVFYLRTLDARGYILAANYFVDSDQEPNHVQAADLHAYRRHIRRILKPRNDDLPDDEKPCESLSKDHLRRFGSSDWEAEMSESFGEDGHPTHRITSCRFWRQCVTTDIAPEHFYGVGEMQLTWNRAPTETIKPYSFGAFSDAPQYPFWIVTCLSAGRRLLGMRRSPI